MEKSVLRAVLADQHAELRRPISPLVARDVDLSEKLSTPEVLVIAGVRRSGKSSLMKYLLGQHVDRPVCYLNLDDSRLTAFELADFQSCYEIWLELYEQRPTDLLFLYDEIQNVSGWERWVSSLAENRRGKVVITGSNSHLLSSELATHLTGRKEVVSLFPLSFREVMSPPTDTENRLSRYSTESKVLLIRRYREYLNYGGFPRVWIDKNLALLGEYYKDIVLNDVVFRKKIRNEKALLELGRMLFTQCGKVVNKSKLARTLGLRDFQTISNYCHYLEEAFLFFEIKKFSFSLKEQTRSLPKFYPVDVALAQHVGFSMSDNTGASLECLVFLELKRRGFEIYYWQNDKGWEVDFVLKRGRSIIAAIQVTSSLSSADVQNRETRALIEIAQVLKVKNLFIVTESEEQILDTGDTKIQVLPFIYWALATDIFLE